MPNPFTNAFEFLGDITGRAQRDWEAEQTGFQVNHAKDNLRTSAEVLKITLDIRDPEAARLELKHLLGGLAAADGVNPSPDQIAAQQLLEEL